MGTHDAPERPWYCTDRILPRDLARPNVATLGLAGRAYAVAPVNRQWPNGSVLSVAFIGGVEGQHTRVREYAVYWEQYANIKFDFRASLPATIRVSFDQGDGAWSYVGTDALEIPANVATMNLGWLTMETVLHEFGHAMSLAHEHQNPQGGIQWNEAAVIADLSGPPNYWTESEIRHNVLEKYALDQVHASAFDPKSIMLYSFPSNWTTNGFSAPRNSAISAGDAAFVGGEKMYPKTSAPPAELRKLPLQLAKAASIGARGELDEYELVVPASGNVVVETAGATDVVLALYRGALKIAENNDAGRGTNARIEATLDAGTYRATVRHRSTGTGRYRVIAWA